MLCYAVSLVNECRLFSDPLTMPVDFLAYGYAATVAAGGIMGYAKAGK